MKQYISKDALVAEIERLREEDYLCDTFEESTGYYNAIDEIATFLDTLEVKDLQEEPVSKNMETDIAIRLGSACHKQVWHENQFSKEDCKAYCSLYKECQECSIDLCMIFFHDPHCHFEEEPVDDLEEESDKYAAAVCQLMVINGNDDDDSIEEYLKRAFKAGAEWQKEQFEKNRLEHCDSITEEQYNLEVGFIDSHIDKYNRMPTFLDAIEYGMEKMKEQLMAKAVEVTVHIDAGGYPYTPEIELYDYDNDVPLAKEGDKYKVVLIKEE